MGGRWLETPPILLFGTYQAHGYVPVYHIWSNCDVVPVARADTSASWLMAITGHAQLYQFATSFLFASCPDYMARFDWMQHPTYRQPRNHFGKLSEFNLKGGVETGRVRKVANGILGVNNWYIWHDCVILVMY